MLNLWYVSRSKGSLCGWESRLCAETLVLRRAVFLFTCQRSNFSFLPVMQVWLEFSVYERIIPGWCINCRKQTIRVVFFYAENTTSPKGSHTWRGILHFTGLFSHFRFLKLTSLWVVKQRLGSDPNLQESLPFQTCKAINYEAWLQKQPHQILQEVIVSSSEHSGHEPRETAHLQRSQSTRGSNSGGSNIVGCGFIGAMTLQASGSTLQAQEPDSTRADKKPNLCINSPAAE